MPVQSVYSCHHALKSFVRYYWSFDLNFNSEKDLDLQLMVDRYPRIVIQCLEEKSALKRSTSFEFVSCIKGVTTQSEIVQMEPRYSHIAVSFYPHAIKALFGIDAHETKDITIDLNDFCTNELTEKIISSNNHQERVRLLDEYLLKRLPQSNSVDCRILDFIKSYSQDEYSKKLKSYGISERHFERKFLQSVGFTPSFYKRVCRFEKVHTQLQSRRFEKLINLAHDYGYSDQSHFNREFKEFSGVTPGIFLGKEKLTEDSGSMVSK